MLAELKKTAATTDQFAAKAKVLKDLVEHHAKEEEEEMFPRAEKTLKQEKLLELGIAIAERKEELLQKAVAVTKKSKK